MLDQPYVSDLASTLRECVRSIHADRVRNRRQCAEGVRNGANLRVKSFVIGGRSV
jgi:hypothetical protein